MKDSDFLGVLKDAGVAVADAISTTTFIDTGAYALNALLCGSIYGGIPGNRVIMWAGAPSAGKSYLTLSTIKTYMDDNPDAEVVFFDTEFALEEEMVEKRGIDIKRFHLVQTDTLQDFRTKIVRILDAMEAKKSKRKVMMVLDSLSNLPTKKEVDDAASGNDVRDMTKSQIIRSIFRIITNKLGKLGIPLQVTSHTYSSMDMYSPVVISGGQGHVYAASTVITLTKAKLKEGTEVIGNIIRATTYKSRYSKENQKIELKLDYNTGLDRYFGLFPIAEKYGLITKEGRKYKLPDGRLVWEKEIHETPEIIYTKEFLDKIDVACKQEYALGMGDGEALPVVAEAELDDSNESEQE